MYFVKFWYYVFSMNIKHTFNVFFEKNINRVETVSYQLTSCAAAGCSPKFSSRFCRFFWGKLLDILVEIHVKFLITGELVIRLSYDFLMALLFLETISTKGAMETGVKLFKISIHLWKVPDRSCSRS